MYWYLWGCDALFVFEQSFVCPLYIAYYGEQSNCLIIMDTRHSLGFIEVKHSGKMKMDEECECWGICILFLCWYESTSCCNTSEYLYAVKCCGFEELFWMFESNEKFQSELVFYFPILDESGYFVCMFVFCQFMDRWMNQLSKCVFLLTLILLEKREWFSRLSIKKTNCLRMKWSFVFPFICTALEKWFAAQIVFFRFLVIIFWLR